MLSAPLRQASCGSCLLGVCRTALEGYPVIRCLRFSKIRNPHDCCRFFLAPEDGFEYPSGSVRDFIPPPALPPSLLVFDPRRGLVLRDLGEPIL